MAKTMRTGNWLSLIVVASGVLADARAESLTVHSGHFEAVIRNGAVVAVRHPAGTGFVRQPKEPRGASIFHLTGTHWSAEVETQAELRTGGTCKQTYREFSGLPDSTIEATYRVDPSAGDLIIRQQAHASAKGVWGVGWSIAEIPLDYNILVPGGSGLRLSQDSPGSHYEFEYPLTWESQFVVVEGPGQCLFVWAEDAKGRFKRLVVDRARRVEIDVRNNQRCTLRRPDRLRVGPLAPRRSARVTGESRHAAIATGSRQIAARNAWKPGSQVGQARSARV